MATMHTLKTLAAEVYDALETKTRTDGTEFISLKDGAPEWMTDLCREAHGNMLPDDHRYAFILEAVEALMEADDPDDIDMEADIYNHDLITWLGSHGYRPGYCDEAREEFVGEPGTLIDQIMLGQAYEKQEVLGLVRSFLENRLEELEAEDDETDDDDDNVTETPEGWTDVDTSTD